MLKALMKRLDHTQENMGNVSRKVESLKKYDFVQIHINLNMFSFRRHHECK